MLDQFIRTAVRYELVSLAIEWLQAGQSVAMVTLVNVEGSSPYPVGTQMLVNQAGEYHGQISGGCAEKAIADQAVTAIHSGENSVQRYGLGSPYFDVQLPCGSGIDVFIDVMTTLSAYEEIQQALTTRARHTQTLELTNASSNKGFNKGSNNVSNTRIDYAFESYDKQYLPNPRLIVFGQGPIQLHTALAALAAGFDTLCIAQNQDTQDLLERQGLHSLLIQDCPVMATICDDLTACISLFHEHEHELDILGKLLKENVFYVGALGSKVTHSTRQDALRLAGLEETDIQRIHGPVGVNIRSNTPAQIAVSIIAEVIDELNKTVLRQ